MRDTLK